MSSDGRFLVILDDKVSVPVIHLLFNQDNKLVLCKGYVVCVSDIINNAQCKYLFKCITRTGM